ncbi:MAG: helix-turn-helix domain-containing protein [Candidatus Thermoplasmatota archaeon]|nr:helix-turn-helix domain-containing protein [Candidatus Thermoplasmatota archaeon]MCL5731485.1 helix-turn-helix domain-containing protein [Candidatus Thermoplasmatota archaeon]
MSRRVSHLKDATIIVRNPDCPIMPRLAAMNISFEITRLSPGVEGTDHLVTFATFRREIDEELSKQSMMVKRFDGYSFWMKTTSCRICRAMSSISAIPTNVRAVSGGRLVYRILMPGPRASTVLRRHLDESGCDYSYSDQDEKLLRQLTPRQKQIFLTAYNAGYFDIDRRISMTDLAKNLHISTKTLQEMLRRSILKVVSQYIKENM